MSRKENNTNVANVLATTHADSSSDSETEFDELLNNNQMISDIQDFLNLSGSDQGFSIDYAQPEKNIKTVLQDKKEKTELVDVCTYLDCYISK